MDAFICINTILCVRVRVRACMCVCWMCMCMCISMYVCGSYNTQMEWNQLGARYILTTFPLLFVCYTHYFTDGYSMIDDSCGICRL